MNITDVGHMTETPRRRADRGQDAASLEDEDSRRE